MTRTRTAARVAAIARAAASTALVLLSLNARGQEGVDDLGTLFGAGPWRLVSVAVSGQTFEVPADAGALFSLNAEGRLAGTVGCNQMVFDSEFEPDGAVSFGPVTATLMACPEPVMSLERAFIDALEGVNSYVVGDGMVTLSGPDAQLVFEAGAQPVPPGSPPDGKGEAPGRGLDAATHTVIDAAGREAVG